MRALIIRKILLSTGCAMQYWGITLTVEPRSTDTRYGHPDITDSFVCPDEKLVHLFKKNNPLIADTH